MPPKHPAPKVKTARTRPIPHLRPGQVATGTFVFREPPPIDGMVESSNPAVATISLTADDKGAMVRYAIKAVADGTATMYYKGTRVPPNYGRAVVKPMVVTVESPEPEDTGSFNEGAVVVIGP